MTLSEIAKTLEFETFVMPEDAAETNIEALYCGDLLSDVMANVPPDSIWFTIQGHVNVVAVAQLRDVACICLVNGIQPDPQTVEKAEAFEVAVCGVKTTSADMCMKLAGNVKLPAARLMVTVPFSSGWRMTSKTLRLNSGSSSMNNTPLWAKLTSPGVGTL